MNYMVVSRSFFRQGHKRSTLDKIIQLHFEGIPYDSQNKITKIWGGAHRGMTYLNDEVVIATELAISEKTENLRTKSITFPVATHGSIIINNIILHTIDGKNITGIEINPENYNPSVGFPHEPLLSIGPNNESWQLYEAHLTPLMKVTLKLIKELYVSDETSEKYISKLSIKLNSLITSIENQTHYMETIEHQLFHKKPVRQQLHRLFLSQPIKLRYQWGNFSRNPDNSVNSLIHAEKINRVRYRPNRPDIAFVDKKDKVNKIHIKGQAELWEIIISEAFELQQYQTLIISSDAFPDYGNLNSLRQHYRLLPVPRRLWTHEVPIIDGFKIAFERAKLGEGNVGVDFVSPDGSAVVVSLLDVLRAIKIHSNGYDNHIEQLEPDSGYDLRYTGVPSISGIESDGYSVQIGNFQPHSNTGNENELMQGYKIKLDHECLRIHYDQMSPGRDWLRFGLREARREKTQEIYLCHHAIMSMLNYMEENGGVENFHVPFPLNISNNTWELFELMHTNFLVETRLPDGKVRRRNLAKIEMEYLLWQNIAYHNL